MSIKTPKKTIEKLGRFYTENLQKHGLSSKSVGWKDEESQTLRFKKLCHVIQLEGRSRQIIINDWGCGYGAMFNYLIKIPQLEITKYYGYDVSQKMLSAAKQNVIDERAEFLHSPDIMYEADYSFICGTFNVRFEASDDLWQQYIEDTLIKTAKKSKKGFSFNLLSKYVDWKKDHLYYGDPFFYFDFCKKHISRYVSLLHDYPLYEWTICVVQEFEE